ncbi:ABC transporter ATP-binding protein [Bacillus sp. WMMC1349]|uniref:ABC transporter ATP-binding protein n=1 Tax=Bacillus sp. WMMC1349 TaxID=2736254 RepID=UPI0015537BE6|nr:ABC transporter ATP-binding protein [Bacillus sp. WMMC1349]NPC91429.1 ABC transporter ATP-binding protein [Bacillus sp. WMMC1349]
MQPVLETEGLSKTFKNKTVIKNINMKIDKGDVYGLIGENGAGKSTLLRLILNDIRPTAGNIQLFGHVVSTRKNKDVYNRVGSFLNIKHFYDNLTVFENLDIHRRLMGFPSTERIHEVLRKFHVLDQASQVIRNLSFGTKARVGLARAFLNYPELIILDEPMIGLDLQLTKELKNAIRSTSQYYESSLLVASNTLTDIEQFCNRIGLLHNGEMIDHLDKGEIQKKRSTYILVRVNHVSKAAFILETQLHIEHYKVTGDRCIQIFDQKKTTSEILNEMMKHRIEVHEIKREKCSLESHFLQKIKGEK